MFEILAEALDPFIAEVLEPQIGDSDWALVVKLADEEKGATGKAYSREDPALQLRMLTEGLTGRVTKGWYPFKGVVTREHEAYASLLRETRNQWAHNASFDDDAALRALDYARLLLAAVGQTDAADEVDAIRLDLRRIATGKQDSRALKSSTMVLDASGGPTSCPASSPPTRTSHSRSDGDTSARSTSNARQSPWIQNYF